MAEPFETQSNDLTSRLSAEVPATTTAATGNLVTNGDFSAGVNDWTFYGPLDAWAPDGTIQFKRLNNSAPGGFWQNTGQTNVPAGTPFTVSVDLGNNGGFNKDVLVRLSDSTRGTALDCTFTVTQASPLQSFTMSGLSPSLFDTLTVTVEETTSDGYPDVLMDNLNVQYAPGQGISTTTCTSPTMQAAPCRSESGPQRRLRGRQ